MAEHDRIVLMADMPHHGLLSGDVGTIVHVYHGGRIYEVEFVALDGETAGIVTVEAKDVRPVARHEIAHVRSLVVT